MPNYKINRIVRRAGACSCRKHSNKLQFEKRLEHRVQAVLALLSFARGQYHRTAPARKIQNLSHFLNILQRVEICYLIFLHAEKVGYR
ncbi:MAG: hypothetical protein PUE60_04830, partial [Eubacteriales bacterium]|nr:hypothetical protein [Eubacteriales bacterium]